MDIAVLGTGMAGRTLSGALADLGHEVAVGTRDVEHLQQTNTDFAHWQQQHTAVRVLPFADAAAHGLLVFNVTAGAASLAALEQAGADNLAGKVLVDVGNPLDFSSGMPPALTVANTDSLGEQIQRALPETKVVKALNTVNAGVMVAPAKVAGGDHDLFVCGNDNAAKTFVTSSLQEWFGWQRFVDLGDISAARAMEMYLPLWLRLMNAVGTPMFSVKVVR
jgi:hypothetical protein